MPREHRHPRGNAAVLRRAPGGLRLSSTGLSSTGLSSTGLNAARRSLRWCLLLAACTDGAPVSLRVGRGDTVVVNHRTAVPLPLWALTTRGDTLRQPAARWRQLDGPSLQLTDSGSVTCAAAFDARVEVQLGTLTRQAVVRCRPIKGFLFFGNAVSLRRTDAPADYALRAIGLDDRPVQLIAGEAAMVDTSIAELVQGKVRPKRTGTTVIRVKAGNCQTSIGVEVRDTVADLARIAPFVDFVRPLRLVSGEYWTTPLPAGHLIIRLDTDSAAHTRLALGVLRANCARIRGEPQHWSCMTGDTSVVVVRRRPAAGAGSDTGQVVITRATWGPTVAKPTTAAPAARRERTPSDTLCPAIFFWTPPPEPTSPAASRGASPAR